MKRICRDVALYWKRYERVEKQQMKRVQKEAQEQRKQDLNMLEVSLSIAVQAPACEQEITPYVWVE